MPDWEKTTVIVPTYNRSALLVEALDSLLSQSLPAGEIIVVDDGSTDDTPERIKAYSDRVRYVRKANGGKSSALNLAIPMAQHPLIWIVDDDDLAQPDALLEMTGAISCRPGTGFVYGRYLRFRDNAETGVRKVFDYGYWRETDSENFLPAVLEDFFAHHSGLRVRRSAYEAVGEFSKDYGRSEDYEMTVRLGRRFACTATPAVVFLQRQHDGERFGGLRANNVMDRWVHEQSSLFSRLHDELPLADYLPAGLRNDMDNAPLLRRQATIARAVVMARKKLWKLSLADFRAACGIPGAADPLSREERAAIRRALFSKYGVAEILADPSIAAGLRDLAGSGRTGRAIARNVARSLLWFIRNRLQLGQLTEAARFARVFLAIRGTAL